MARKDELYVLQDGHLFASPRPSLRCTSRFYVTLLFSANHRDFEVATDQTRISCRAAAIRPGVTRRVDAGDSQLVTVMLNPRHPHFVDFRSISAAGVEALDAQAFAPLHDALASIWHGEADTAQAQTLADSLVATAVQMLPAATTAVDDRVRAVAASVLRHAQRDSDLPMLESLAREVELSPSRLSHLFVESFGLTLRNYLGWARIQRAAALLNNKKSLTDIAHEAGFADLAHMSRVVTGVFGAPPSYFLQSGRVNIHVAHW